MGGTITVSSAPGIGSVFTFRFPIVNPVPEQSGEPMLRKDQPVGGDPISRSKSLVLVVEDDPSSSMLAGKMLESLGYRAEFAADGAEAIQAFVPGKYLAILMDMAMPLMDGLEATKKIRELEATGGCRVPIIAFTANVMHGEREQYLAAGMDGSLSKPFKRAELAAKLACVAQIERAAEGGEP